MPPKDKGKPQDKAKQKSVEDKTFGLKNKSKSAKVAKFVQTLQTQQSQKQKRMEAQDPNVARKEKKKADEERQKELNALFAVAIKQPKVPLGVDPKSIVCEFFRHGQCTKGFKCKFSHDLTVERKGAKIDIFTDRREGEGEGEGEGEELDQETLERMVAEKHNAENKNRPTDIICKFFLDAVERKQYGWFWKCPNGDACKYRHGLPPGYVLKSQMKELLEEEARNAKDVSETIEEERAKVDARTPITEQTFNAWHEARREAKLRALEEAELERRKRGALTGREIFQQEGFMAVDDAAAGGDDDYARGDDEERRIQEMFAQAQANMEAARVRREQEATEAPGSSGGEHWRQQQQQAADAVGAAPAGPSGAVGAAPAGPVTTLQLAEGDEALFDDDDDDELDDAELAELEQQLAGAAVGS